MWFRETGIWKNATVALFACVAVGYAVSVNGQTDPRRSNELRAVSVLREIGSVQLEYFRTCGKGNFATSFKALAGGGSKTQYLDPLFSGSATPTQSHYRFSLEAGHGSKPGPMDCNGRPTASTYYATATPETFGHDGGRSFALSSDALIWQAFEQTAPKEPFGPPAEIIK